MLITLITIFCLGEVCTNPNNDVKTVTINKSDIVLVEDHGYFWKSDGKFEENGAFTPNKGATKMKGCYIRLRGEQRFPPIFTEFPCEDYVLPKLK
jgi:hypothetical protein